MKHCWGRFKNCTFKVINYCRVRFMSAPAETWSYKSSLCDTHFSYFSSLEDGGISILHQVWSWASGLMSQMVSRRQPIYRPVCMVDVTSSVSAVHQLPATQHSLTSGSQHYASWLILSASLWLSVSTWTLSFLSGITFTLLLESCWCSTISLDTNKSFLPPPVVWICFLRELDMLNLTVMSCISFKSESTHFSYYLYIQQVHPTASGWSALSLIHSLVVTMHYAPLTNDVTCVRNALTPDLGHFHNIVPWGSKLVSGVASVFYISSSLHLLYIARGVKRDDPLKRPPAGLRNSLY